MGTFLEIVWVIIVACIAAALIIWGTRTTMYRLSGVAISAGALIWAWVRPDNGGWFLYRPIEAGWAWLIVLLLIASLIIGFFMWRLAKLTGWIAVFIAVFVPLGDLFSSELWGDLWPGDRFDDWPGADWLWWVVAILVIVGAVLLLFSLRLIGVALVILAFLLGAINLGLGLLGTPYGKDLKPPAAIDKCRKIDHVDNPEIQTEIPDGMTDTDGDGFCLTDKVEGGPDAGGTPSPYQPTDCPERFEQRSISDSEYRRFVRDGIDSATSERSWKKLGNQLAHDASSLRQMAIYIGVPDVPPLGRLLNDSGDCLSEEGIELWNDTMNIGRGMLASRFSTAPLDGHNSWINRQGHLIIGSEHLITGDRKALVFVDSDGRRRYILVRCGNPVFSSHK